MRLRSPAFSHMGMIPKKYTCQGEDINPALMIEDIPKTAKSLVLIIDDPDAPHKTWVHWVVYNIPIIEKIEENSVPGLEGMNDFGRLSYGGPCPPTGLHRYFFKLYALDAMLLLKEGLTKSELEEMIEGNILDYTELIGLFKKE